MTIPDDKERDPTLNPGFSNASGAQFTRQSNRLRTSNQWDPCDNIGVTGIESKQCGSSGQWFLITTS